MIGNGAYLLFAISFFSFVIGIVHRVTLEFKMKNKQTSYNRLERLEALEFSYYCIGIIFLVLGFLLTGAMLF